MLIKSDGIKDIYIYLESISLLDSAGVARGRKQLENVLYVLFTWVLCESCFDPSIYLLCESCFDYYNSFCCPHICIKPLYLNTKSQTQLER